jgi:hypothetical protein
LENISEEQEKVSMTKLQCLLQELLSREVERRVELHFLPPEVEGLKPAIIKQGFIKEIQIDNKPFVDVRIRDEDGKYTMTAKHRPAKQEATTKISKEIYDALWKKVSKKQIKHRYKLPTGWIVDDIKGYEEKRIVAEYEYGKKPEGEKDTSRIPKTFKVKRDLGKE